MSVRENYIRICENIEDACARAGRSRDTVTLVAVTKFVEEARIEEAVAAGIREVGENRVQEWQRKYGFFQEHGLGMHLIGQLQTNKVKYVVNRGLTLIQSVDRLSLAQEIERQCALHNAVQDVLIEVNIGEEEQKGGVAQNALGGLLDAVSALSHIRVKGLMCIPPALGAGEARPYFARMRALFEKFSAYRADNVEMRVLSMGMSGDYAAAVEEGATMVRVGTALFGARN